MNTQNLKNAGVDVPLSDRLSSYFGGLCRSTYENSPFTQVIDMSEGHFRGPRGFTFRNLPEGYVNVVAPDGIGTKVALTAAAKKQSKSGRDLLGMTVGDITRHGGMGLIVSNVLDTSAIGNDEDDPLYKAHLELGEGLRDGARALNLVLINGETAVLGACVGSPLKDLLLKYNWAGFAIGVNHPDKVITGKKIQPGDSVVAFREKGHRSNGFSLLRKILAAKFGEEYWNNPEAQKYIEMAAEPSVLYDSFLTELNGWTSPRFEPLIKLTGIAHLSGGGIESKFGDDLVLRQSLSAVLNDLWEPSELMKYCAQWGNLPDEECYASWHGGQGVLAVCRPNREDELVDRARERGIDAKPCGKITEPGSEGPTIEIVSKFSGKTIRFDKKQNS